MFKKSAAWPLCVYAAILLFLGIYGYSVSESRVSLFMGLGSGTLLILSALSIFSGKKWGFYLALGVTAALTAVFAVRYLNTHKPIPTLLLFLSSALLIYLLVLFAKKKN